MGFDGQGLRPVDPPPLTQSLEDGLGFEGKPVVVEVSMPACLKGRGTAAVAPTPMRRSVAALKRREAA